MEQLNNLDVFFLIIVGISALVGIARGFTKELLSVLGWAVAGTAVYFLTPIVTPIMKNYISSDMLANAVSGMLVLLVVCVFWVLAVDKIASSIRQSKLSPLDRLFGLAFGALRGVLVVVLLVMMISSLIPEESKKGTFESSKIFVASADLVEPIKSMIPQETIESMQEQMAKFGLNTKKTEEVADAEDKETKTDKKDDKKIASKNTDKHKSKKDKTLPKDATDAFMKLAQPKIESAEDLKDLKEAVESFDEMSGDLQKLVDAIEDQTITEDEDFGL